MATRNRCLLGSFFCFLLAAAVLAFFSWSSRTAINLESYERIQVGMTLSEVEAILGGPERDESTGSLTADADPKDDLETRIYKAHRVFIWHFQQALQGGGVNNQSRSRFWVSNKLMIRVAVDADGHVADKACVVVRCEENAVQMLRRWLGL